MTPSNVYYTTLRTRPGDSLLNKLERLLDRAGMGKIDFTNKYVAIKIHFGEPGNLSYLRPNYAKVVADFIRARGGKPFLTDCNTLYVGRRKNAIEHMDAAYENGIITRVLTTNLVYQTPELLKRPYYVNCDMSKYIAYLIDTLNHDASISDLLNPYERIKKIVTRYKNGEFSGED